MPTKTTGLFFDPSGTGLLVVGGGSQTWTSGTGYPGINSAYGAMVYGFVLNSGAFFSRVAILHFDGMFGFETGWHNIGSVYGSNSANAITYGAFEVPYGMTLLRAVAESGSQSATFHGVYSYNQTK